MADTLKVLILEDRATDAELIVRELRKAGFTPEWQRVESQQDYLACLRSDLDLIIADYYLPQFDALQALQLLQERDLDIPFIVATGSTDEEVVAKCMREGAADYLLKDRLARLGHAVTQVLHQKRLRDEKQLAVKSLRESERKYREIVELAHEGIWTIDANAVTVFVNQQMGAILGYTVAEMIGKPLFNFMDARGIEIATGLFERQRTGLTERLEFELLRKDGSRAFAAVAASPVIDEHGLFGGAVAWIEDITEIKKFEAERERLHLELKELANAAQQRASELQSILDNIVDGVYVADSRGQITLANTASLRLFGMHDFAQIRRLLEELPSLLKMTHLDGRPVDGEELPLSRALRGEIVTAEDMAISDLQNFKKTYLRTSAAPIRNKVGEIVGAVAVSRDVTTLTELDQMKDQFIGVAAHELKTPVAIVKGYAQALQKSSPDLDRPHRHILDAIVRGADRIDGMVQDLLDVWQLQGGELGLEKEKCDLAEILEQVVDQMALAANKHRISIVETSPTMVSCDRERIKQVLVSLLDNAIRYSPNGGEITTSLSMSNGEAVVSIADQGVGIPREKQGPIPSRFYRAHTGTPYDYGGLGVGLHISEQVVRQHGGRVWFESTEGQGSTFYFSLLL